jgi:lipopolysaccharide biosynthesis glycosyltransferase
MKTINILCSTDDNYVPYCGIMLTSLFENNRKHQLCTYILTEGLHQNNTSLFSQLAERYNTPIHIVRVSDERIAPFPIFHSYHSLAAYYRLLAPILLPPEVERIIYFDCDIIIDSDIESLWNEDVEDVAFGAVIDQDYFCRITNHRLGIPEDIYTFNSGMLLINLKYWRLHSIMERCFDYIQKSSDKIIFCDQDALNYVVTKERKLLPIQYNFQTGFIHQDMQLDEHILDEVKRAIQHHIVIHYTFFTKPWMKYAYVAHPYRFKYRYYRSISLWKDYPLVCNMTISQRMSLLLYRIACVIGIRKRAQIYINVADAAKRH